MCYWRFDFIGRLETSTKDTEFVMKSRKDDVLGPDAHQHKTSGGSTTNLTLKYFSKLSKYQILGLIERYRFDFQAFGYKYDCFLQ